MLPSKMVDEETGPAVPALPPVLAVGWGVQAAPARGPRPGMSAAGIVAAAMELADADGIAAVSMAKVAERLGFTTMSLYRYVSSKDDLLALMFDAAVGDPPPRARRRGWRTGLTRWAHGVFESYRRHPWALDIPITGPPALPNQLAWLDWGLAAMEATTLEISERLSVMVLLSGYVRSVATLTRDIAGGHQRAGSTPASVQADYEALLGSLVTAARFPALHAAVHGGLFTDGDPDDLEFGFGLSTILDGVDALIRRRAPD
jgi:AcrR family transcriptional regulator